MAYDNLLEQTLAHAQRFLDSLPTRPVGATASLEEVRQAFDHPLPDNGIGSSRAIEELATRADPGLVASAGPRFFGFVIGGSHPAALAADWLTSTWDQNTGLYVISPTAAVLEEVAAKWLLELLDLPRQSGVGFVTGGQMANFTCLAAARHAVLKEVGWDVEAEGLIGAPTVYVLVGRDAHVSILVALRFLGLGGERVRHVDTDDQGRMIPADLVRVLNDCDGPTIVCAQAGDVNTGAFDPFSEITAAVHEHGGWVHVDGAFGLWAAATPSVQHLAHGMSDADSWAVDGHKWLNVPYDSGIAIVRDQDAHRAAMGVSAAYLIKSAGAERDNVDYTPEFSRRGRGIPVYAVLSALGRNGLIAMIERCCSHARRLRRQLIQDAMVKPLNDVVLNQVLVRFEPPQGDPDEFVRAVVRNIQQDGTCWLSGTKWRGREAMRASIVNWSTTQDDIDRSAEAILRVAHDTAKRS